MLVDAAPLWTKNLNSRLRGLSLAREKGWLLAWDKNHWLYLLNPSGEVQGQVHFEEPLVAAAISDDGSGLAAVGQNGLVRWFHPDLSLLWQRSLHLPLLSLALDPLGDLLAVADGKGGVHFFGRDDKLVGQFQSARPMHHLAFIPEAPLVMGCADFGLVGAFDLKGDWAWRGAPVVHAGALTVTGDGSTILLASFSEGLYQYGFRGERLDRLTIPETCPLAAITFLGDLILAAGMGNTLYFLDHAGTMVSRIAIEKPVQALALGALGTTAYLVSKDGDLTRLKISKGAEGNKGLIP